MAGMDLASAVAHIAATDERFALGEAVVRGVPLPVFLNAPPTLRDLQRHGRETRAFDDYIVYEGERLSYDDWCAATNRVSRLLTTRFGVKPGDRVAIAMRNYPEFLTLFMGVVNIGAVAVLLNAWWTADELAYGFSDSGAKLAFADGPRWEKIATFAPAMGVEMVMVRDPAPAGALSLAALLEETPAAGWPDAPIDTDDDFAIMYSSGSTGDPKGVVLTHRGAISATYSWFFSLQLPPLMAPADAQPPAPRPPVMLCATPLFHVTATHPIFMVSMAVGAKLVLIRKWEADAALRLIRDEGVTRFVGVPTMAADLREASLRLGLDAPSLESLGSGGAKRPAAQVAQQAAAFPKASIASGWGMTETNALGLGIAGPDYVAMPESAGRLYPPLQEIRIVDDDGRPLPNGEVGEIIVKSAANMRCYHNKPEATAETLRDGWLFTGDLGRIDDEGYVTIVDRKKSIIIRGGENISALEVEGALHQHPAVAEAAAFPLPDERLGEIVGAAIWPTPGETLDLDALRAFLGSRIAGFKIPERIWIVDRPLPRGGTDKIDRRGIRASCIEGGLGVEAAPAPAP